MTIYPIEVLEKTFLFLGRITRGQVKAWIQLEIIIAKIEEDLRLAELINEPPVFLTVLKNEYITILDEKEAKLKY